VIVKAASCQVGLRLHLAGDILLENIVIVGLSTAYSQTDILH